MWGEQGSSSSDNYGVAIGNNGTAYFAGYFQGTMNFGSQSLNSLGEDAFLVKYDQYGNIIWTKQSKVPSPFSSCAGIYINSDKQGNIYYTGCFTDTVSFGVDTLLEAKNNNNTVFLAKYYSNGNVLWAKQSRNLAPNDWDVGAAVAVDGSKNIFLAGYFLDTTSFGLFTVNNPSQTYLDAFLVKYDSNGNVLWAKQSVGSGSSNVEFVNSLAVDDSGSAYVLGSFIGTITFGAYTLSSLSFFGDAFLVKYDRIGNVRWAIQSKAIPSSSYCYGYAVITDASEDVYLTGAVSGNVTFGSFNLDGNSTYASLGEGGDIFLAKYNSNGAILWAKQSQSLGGWAGYSLAKDTINEIYLSGGGYYGAGASNFTIIYGIDTLVINNATDPSVIYKLDTEGNVLCGSIIGTGGDDNNGIACSPSGQFVYFGGDILDTITFGPDFLSNSAGETPFIARWQPCCSDLVALTGNSFLCSGSSAVLRTSGGTSYFWSTGQTTDSIIINPRSTTTYTVLVENQGCAYSISKTVVVNPLPSLNICCDSSIVYGQSVQLFSSRGTKYQWLPNTGLSCDTCPNPIAMPIQTTTYTLTVNSDSGCIATKYITIDVSCGQVFIPTAFSPSASYNTILYVRGPCISKIEFLVFDRWGNKVFESQYLDKGWDGNFRGQAMNAGTYIYYVKATLLDGTIVERNGNVTLVR